MSFYGHKADGRHLTPQTKKKEKKNLISETPSALSFFCNVGVNDASFYIEISICKSATGKLEELNLNDTAYSRRDRILTSCRKIKIRLADFNGINYPALSVYLHTVKLLTRSFKQLSGRHKPPPGCTFYSFCNQMK